MTLVCGGQTGVDRAMLDFCLENNLHSGGWCTEGRIAEDGLIPLLYPVKELPGASYEERTMANVRDSDALVVIFFRRMKGGTGKSVDHALEENKPVLELDMSRFSPQRAAQKLMGFISENRPKALNISGPRLSEWPGGYDSCTSVLEALIKIS